MGMGVTLGATQFFHDWTPRLHGCVTGYTSGYAMLPASKPSYGTGYTDGLTVTQAVTLCYLRLKPATAPVTSVTQAVAWANNKQRHMHQQFQFQLFCNVLQTAMFSQLSRQSLSDG